MPEAPPIPPIDDGLLKYLEFAFPDRLPQTELSQFELGKRVGAASVVYSLRARQREQLTTPGGLPSVLKQA